jgi:hypothetical protein
VPETLEAFGHQTAEQRDRGESRDRHAEQQRDRQLAGDPRCRERGTDDDPDNAEDQRSDAWSRHLRLREVTDRTDDVESGDPHARHPDGRQRDHEAGRGADREAEALDHERVTRSLRVRSEDGTRDDGDEPSDADADDSAESCGDRRVDRPLDRERPRQTAPGESDGAHHPELGLAFLGEHHEQVDEQEDSGDDTEQTDRAEELRETAAQALGFVEDERLRGFDLHPGHGVQGGLQPRHDRVRHGSGIEHAPLERHEHACFRWGSSGE